jgi:hypothetical protein
MRVARSSRGFTEDSRFKLTLGNFGYGYNPDVKNLGQYLLRGYVYPGSVVSGFGNVFGAVARYEAGKFGNDLILKSENEDKPVYDFSLANVLTFRPVDGVELGAGVNFHRLIAGNGKFRDPGTKCPLANNEQCFILDTVSVDTVSTTAEVDTITGDLSGTKLMARFSLDPKRLMGFGGIGGLKFGKSDLVLYGEAAVLGLTDYPK